MIVIIIPVEVELALAVIAVQIRIVAITIVIGERGAEIIQNTARTTAHWILFGLYFMREHFSHDILYQVFLFLDIAKRALNWDMSQFIQAILAYRNSTAQSFDRGLIRLLSK